MKRVFRAAISTAFFIVATGTSAKAEDLRLGSTGAVAALLQRLADAHAASADHHRVQTIPGLGSGGAIAAVAAGALDLAISSRDLNDKERTSGVVSAPLFETPYVFVSSIGAELSLSADDILGYYAGTTRYYPTGETVRLILRPRSDANTVYVTSVIPGMTAAQEQARKRHDIPVASTDQDNMQHMKSIAGAFSGMSLTQLTTEPNSLQRVRLNGVEATRENAERGAYPYKIVMFVVTRKEASASARAFQAFLASSEARSIIDSAGGKIVTP